MSAGSSFGIRYLAVGAYDVEVDGVPIAALVQEGRCKWTVELLDPAVSRPPFAGCRYRFENRKAALAWLGNPEILGRLADERTATVGGRGEDEGDGRYNGYRRRPPENDT